MISSQAEALTSSSARTPATDYRDGRWYRTLPDDAWSNAMQTLRPADWITWLDVCHALRGVNHADLERIATVLNTGQLKRHPGLFWRCQMHAYRLDRSGARVGAAEGEAPAPTLAAWQQPNRQLSTLLARRQLGACVDDYPGLLAALQQADRSGRSRHGEAASQLLHDTCSLDQWIRACGPAARIAVVGNAPSVLVERHGAEIDRCDAVIRFNVTGLGLTGQHSGVSPVVSKRSDPSALTAAIGQRTDLWVMSPATSVANKPVDASSIVVSGVNPWFRPSRYWRKVARLHVPVYTVNPAIWYALVAELEAPPSAGLLLLAALYEHADSLDVRRFGFSESITSRRDQPNHHADQTPASSRHNWVRESAWLAQRKFP